MGLNTCLACTQEILRIIFDLLLFLAISNDDSDSIEGLIGIASALPISLHSLL